MIIFLDTKDKSVAGILNFLEFILEFKGGILSDYVAVNELRKNKSFH